MLSRHLQPCNVPCLLALPAACIREEHDGGERGTERAREGEEGGRREGEEREEEGRVGEGDSLWMEEELTFASKKMEGVNKGLG